MIALCEQLPVTEVAPHVRGLAATGQGNAEGMRNLKLRLEDPPIRKHTVFTGAAVLADIMKDSELFWVTKAEFAEDPHRAAQRCGNHSLQQ